MKFDKVMSCSSKREYATFAGANKSLRALRRARNQDQPENMRVYSCRYCKQFHIGHESISKRKGKHV